MVVLFAPGKSGESLSFPHPLDLLWVPRLEGGHLPSATATTGWRLRADKAYPSRQPSRTAAAKEDRGGHRRTVRSGPETGVDALPPGDRPPVFDSVDDRGRHVVERRFCHLSSGEGWRHAITSLLAFSRCCWLPRS